MYQMVTPFQQHLRHVQESAPQSTCIDLPQSLSSTTFMPPIVVPMNSSETGPTSPEVILTKPFKPPVMMNSPLLESCGFTPQLNNYNNAHAVSGDPYSCIFLGQIQGCWRIGSSDGLLIQVVLSVEAGSECAVVRNCNPGINSFVEQRIYEEESRFTLCSVDGYVKAVMLKGTNMRFSVAWYANDGRCVVWQREGNVAFQLCDTTPSASRRHSITSELSGSSQMSNTSVGVTEQVSTDGHMLISSEQLKLNEEHSNSGNSSTPFSSCTLEQRMSWDTLFELFKSHCRKQPILLRKVLDWGISQTPNLRVGAKEISDFGSGRVWVSANGIPSDKEKGEKPDAFLDAIKGAYQESSPGVYKQPAPEPNEPGVQHRLRRKNLGLWIIEEYDLEQNLWRACAQELPYGRWLDLKNDRRLYIVNVVPMSSILLQMKDVWSDREELKKSVEFLFNSCNQIKLNTKLKTRNLKHNISNLRLKLEKQYALSFAVQVSTIADCIAWGEEVSERISA